MTHFDVDATEIRFHAEWACGRFGHKMRGRRIDTFDLHEAFCAYRLVTTSRVIDIWRIILDICKR